MKILVIGSGGREHAICKKLAESPLTEKLYCAPGNGGTAGIAENVEISVEDIESLKEFALKNTIDLTIVGPELPLTLGIADAFNEVGLRVFGPDKASAELEASKNFTKEFLYKYEIPTAKYAKYDDFRSAMMGLKDFDYPVVIKADGLCAGKGVIICKNKDEAHIALKEILIDGIFGEEGKSVVMEEFLRGFEASVFCIVSKGRLVFFNTAKDYKQIYDGDEGPNTGGVGCFSPNLLLSDEELREIVDVIIPKIESGLLSEGLNFSGVLFIGFMINDEGPKVLEFNVRFGDPETQVLMPRLESDLVTICLNSLAGNLTEEDIRFSEKTALAVIMTSKGYPGSYQSGFEINGIHEFEASSMSLSVIQSGTSLRDGVLKTAGGRVLSAVALDKNIIVCRETVYKNIDTITYLNRYYRKDIGEICLH